MKNWIKKAASVALIATLLAGCSLGGNKEESSEPSTLKVMYYDENSFYQEYGMLFSSKYPNVDLQVVSTQSLYRSNNGEEEFDYEKALKEFIEKEKPDILMLEMNEYEKKAEAGELLDIGSYMAKDKFDTEGLVPGMVDYMKELGGGQLYGLPSSFSSQALFYNKALFDKYNIPYPTDNMTWNEVIQLSKQFPTEGEKEDRVYGLKAGYRSNLNEFASTIAAAEGLNFVNPNTKTMTINSAGWKTAVQTAYEAIKSDTLYFEENNMGYSGSYEDYLLRNPFVTNRVAMSMEGSYFIREMKEAAEYYPEEGKVIKDWDIVTMPVSPQMPDQSAGTYYSNIFAIAKDSPNADAAWQFISYVTSEEHARLKSKLTYGNFSIHTKFIKDEEGRNYEAFYKLKPMKQQFDYRDMEKLPKQFSMMFNSSMNEEFQAVQDGNKSVEEALENLQLKGEELLAQESVTQDELEEMWQKQSEEEMKKMQEAAGEAVSEDSADSETVVVE